MSGFEHWLSNHWHMADAHRTWKAYGGLDAMLLLLPSSWSAVHARKMRRSPLGAISCQRSKGTPAALRELQQGNIAPVDLAQAAIGPGMAVFSRYRQVLKADGSPMRVRAALALINQAMDEFLTEQEGEYDADTRWALAWFEQYGQESGPYGVAETLSKAKNTSPEGLVRAGILESRAGQVRLLRREELRADWDPHTDERPTAWEAAPVSHPCARSGRRASGVGAAGKAWRVERKRP